MDGSQEAVCSKKARRAVPDKHEAANSGSQGTRARGVQELARSDAPTLRRPELGAASTAGKSGVVAPRGRVGSVRDMT
ncbi:hypothetical protein PSPO01_16401 [Paraphaeosphaeria sporulosa]